eukprot:905307-Prymnesium_polylepis.2
MSLWVHRGPAHRPKSGFAVWQTTRGSRRNIGTCSTVRYGTVTPTPSMEHRASARQNAHQ